MSDAPEATPSEQPGASTSVIPRVVVGLVLGSIPFLLLVFIYRGTKDGLESNIDRLPDEDAKQALIARGPAIITQLLPYVYEADNPDEKQLAIIDVIVQSGGLDTLPIFVKRAYFSNMLKDPFPENRLTAIRALRTIGPPFSLEDAAKLLDDGREATVLAAPAVPMPDRKNLGVLKGKISDEAADLLAAALVVIITVDHHRITPDTPTAQMIPEIRAARVEAIHKQIERLKKGLPFEPPPPPPPRKKR